MLLHRTRWYRGNLAIAHFNFNLKIPAVKTAPIAAQVRTLALADPDGPRRLDCRESWQQPDREARALCVACKAAGEIQDLCGMHALGDSAGCSV